MGTHNIMCRKAIISVFKEGKLVLIYKTMGDLEQIMFDDVLSLSEPRKLLYGRKISLHVPKGTG